MQARMVWGSGLLVLILGGFAALSLTRGQVPPVSSSPPTAPTPSPSETTPKPVSPAEPAPTPGGTPLAPEKTGPGRDLSKLTPLQEQIYWNAQRGADWLYRRNNRDGRFVYGFQPSLNTVLEGNHYLRQIGAAFALARAARFLGDDRYAARATQALLLLLSDTVADPKHPDVRYTAMPSTVVNRLGSAGWLVLAIHELPAPKEDLLHLSDQLCNYIRQQQGSNGSLSYTDGGQEGLSDSDELSSCVGPALHGLMRSMQHRPQPWKLEVVRKARAYYHPRWQAHKTPTLCPALTAAYTEAFLLTQERAFADGVNEMNDWICGLQYERFDPQRPFWLGGFMGWANGKPVAEAPHVLSAAYAEGLAEACRVARATGDLARHQRYAEALEHSLQFLATLQYTTANTQHFADWYQEKLLGGFHASHQDGTLRIDYTQHAVSAMVQYLTYVR